MGNEKNQRRGAPPKLTDEQVREMRRRAASGETYAALALAFGVADAYVGAIVRRAARADVPPGPGEDIPKRRQGRPAGKTKASPEVVAMERLVASAFRFVAAQGVDPQKLLRCALRGVFSALVDLANARGSEVNPRATPGESA